MRRVFTALSAAALLLLALVTARAETDLLSLSQDPKQWPMAPRDYANTRYSALDQINGGNVGQLSLAWSFSLGSEYCAPTFSQPPPFKTRRTSISSPRCWWS